MAGNAPQQPAARAQSPRLFNCPHCGGSILLRAQGFSVTAVCRSCGSIIATANENLRIISQVTAKMRREPLIPLGQRGKLRGFEWEVIGYMERSEKNGLYPWSEYLLFNPRRGYRWLMEFDGHWTYYVTTRDRADRQSFPRPMARYLGRNFPLFHRGGAKVNYVIGEFYWRVRAGEEVEVEDYIYPPEILSLERSKDEVVWSVGEYVEPETIAEAFSINRAMPVRVGVAPNQPSTVKARGAPVFKAWAWFVAVMLLIQTVSLFSSHSEHAQSVAETWRAGEPQRLVVTPPFELKYGTANVSIISSAPGLDNTWLELDMELVNEQTGVAYPLEQGMEFYSGRDVDGYWSEGSANTKTLLSSIPSGLYHLNVQAVGPVARDVWGTRPVTEQRYYVSVERDVPTWSNFFLALLLVSIWPVVLAWRNHSFEQSRWSTSDFSPYWSSESADEE